MAERETRLDDGRQNASVRLQRLLEDDAMDEALDVAMTQAAHPRVLTAVAQSVGDAHPKAAAGLFRRAADAELPHADAKCYQHVVPLIRSAAQLDDNPEARDWITQIRTRYSNRPKLMGMMDKAGLQ